jgi:predicted DNA-binding mobile mystery protein A
MRNQKQLILEQLDNRLGLFRDADQVPVPEKGWIHAIRTSLNMTLEQIGRKMGVTRQAASRIEHAESSGGISLKTLREAGKAMGMHLVYGFVPEEGSVRELVESRSRELATRIVLRTHTSMMIEDQATEQENLKNAIDELTRQYVQEVKRAIWD